jgi:hypothetical protein
VGETDVEVVMSDINPSRDGRRQVGFYPCHQRRPAAATEPLTLLRTARYAVRAHDDHASGAWRDASRKTTAPRRIPVAVPER